MSEILSSIDTHNNQRRKKPTETPAKKLSAADIKAIHKKFNEDAQMAGLSEIPPGPKPATEAEIATLKTKFKNEPEMAVATAEESAIKKPEAVKFVGHAKKNS